MDRKKYISPSADFVELRTGCIANMTITGSKGDSGDEVMTKEDDRTGDWDNIWGS